MHRFLSNPRMKFQKLNQYMILIRTSYHGDCNIFGIPCGREPTIDFVDMIKSICLSH